MADKDKAPRVQWFHHEEGDLFGGQAFGLTVGCQIALSLHNATVTTVIPGPFCVEAGEVYSAGPDIGDVTEDGAGQAGC